MFGQSSPERTINYQNLAVSMTPPTGSIFSFPERRTTMADKLIAFYPHRRNKDGSYDSIGLTCFVTVASGKSEAELMKSDAKHVCAYSTLSQRANDRNVSRRKRPNSTPASRMRSAQT